MCGFVGFVNYGNRDSLKRSVGTIKHRGPDGQGMYWNEQARVGLGHRRLSIVDLSEAAAQPFYSDDNSLVIVFNGEIRQNNKTE